jgi:hypothetical protein
VIGRGYHLWVLSQPAKNWMKGVIEIALQGYGRHLFAPRGQLDAFGPHRAGSSIGDFHQPPEKVRDRFLSLRKTLKFLS